MIHKFGADGVRVGVLISSPAGNDLPFDTSQCEQGRNFSNKIWNAFRLISSWEVKDIEQPSSSAIAIEWFTNKFQKTLAELNELYDNYKISEALMVSYKLVWDDFCSWYLEIIKPGYQHPIDRKTLEQSITIFNDILKVLHPFMPFVTEEIWHQLSDQNEDLVVSCWPQVSGFDAHLLTSFSGAADIVSSIRNIRKQQNIGGKVKLELYYSGKYSGSREFTSMIRKMANLSVFEATVEKIGNSNGFIVDGIQFYVPFGDAVDVKEERTKLEQELDYSKGFLVSVQKKLGNERFVNSAPATVVENEKKKQADTLLKISLLEEKLSNLN